jgi:hypothetical protein
LVWTGENKIEGKMGENLINKTELVWTGEKGENLCI